MHNLANSTVETGGIKVEPVQSIDVHNLADGAVETGELKVDPNRVGDISLRPPSVAPIEVSSHETIPPAAVMAEKELERSREEDKSRTEPPASTQDAFPVPQRHDDEREDLNFQQYRRNWCDNPLSTMRWGLIFNSYRAIHVFRKNSDESQESRLRHVFKSFNP